MPTIDHKPNPLPSLISVAAWLAKANRAGDARAVRNASDKLAKVRERCEHTKWISHHTDAFHGELKLAREILAILEE